MPQSTEKSRLFFAASLAFCVAVPAVAADMVVSGDGARPVYVQTHRPYRQVQTAYAHTQYLDCGNLRIDYREPPVTEIVQVCHPPIFGHAR